MKHLDREGIFKARPFTWQIKSAEHSQAVAVSIEYTIVAQLEESQWTDWGGFQEHFVFGDTWIVTKDGSIRAEAVASLKKALGWDGNLRRVKSGPPPDVVVQITVKGEEYKGKIHYKASWIQPGDYSPRPEGASEDQVTDLEGRFGALLRAAASSVESQALAAETPRVVEPMMDIPF